MGDAWEGGFAGALILEGGCGGVLIGVWVWYGLRFRVGSWLCMLVHVVVVC